MNPWGARREGASATESLIVSNKPSKVSTAAGAELAAASINALLDSVNKIAGLGGGSDINSALNKINNVAEVLVTINNVAEVLVTTIASISSTQSGSAQNKDSAADANPANPVFSFH